MNDMVERVAKAMADAATDVDEYASDAMVRAGIAAMREPTKEMTDAACRVRVSGADLYDFCAYDCAPTVWQAMIDEALKTRNSDSTL